MDHLGDLISTALQTAAHELPAEGMAAVWVALVVGLLIWWRGRKMAKLAFAGFGAVALGLIGWLLADTLGAGQSAWMGGVAGLAAGAMVGCMLLRFTVAVALAMVFALVTPMLTASAMARWGTPDALREQAQHAADGARALLLDGVPEVDTLPPAKDLAIDALKEHASDSEAPTGVDRARAFLARLGEELTPVWEKVPEQDRVVLVAATGVGAVVGFVIGMLFHKKATTVVTAGVGAALWVPAAVVAYGSFKSLPQTEIPTWPALWAGLWAGAVVLGVVLQSRGRKHSADSNRDSKPADAKAA